MREPSLRTTLKYHVLAILAVTVVLYWEGLEKWDRWWRRNVVDDLDEDDEWLTEDEIQQQVFDEGYVNRYLASIEGDMRQLR